MVHMGNDRHIPYVGLLVHDGPDLVYCEVHLGQGEGENQADPGLQKLGLPPRLQSTETTRPMTEMG